jgi:hypothetical protein
VLQIIVLGAVYGFKIRLKLVSHRRVLRYEQATVCPSVSRLHGDILYHFNCYHDGLCIYYASLVSASPQYLLIRPKAIEPEHFVAWDLSE